MFLIIYFVIVYNYVFFNKECFFKLLESFRILFLAFLIGSKMTLMKTTVRSLLFSHQFYCQLQFDLQHFCDVANFRRFDVDHMGQTPGLGCMT